MTITDWVIGIALILIVFRQLREQRLSVRTILLPLVIMGWAAAVYLRGVPIAGNDLALIVLLTAVGAVFGLSSGMLTQVRYSAGTIRVRATGARQRSGSSAWVRGWHSRCGLPIHRAPLTPAASPRLTTSPAARHG